ncbi:MAG TPA: HNH endonuclease [Pirellulaceae bacterium]|nr:HNH endonuclease [Pirellulaceae bacterium]
MAYRITKDCGTGWDECELVDEKWGLSDRQRRLAEKCQEGDVFLHFIDHVQAWAGYSEVIGTLQKNDRDSHTDWISALPWVIPIRKIRWLTKNECQATLDIPGLSHKNFHRQVTFSTVCEDDGNLIAAAIENAAKVAVSEPSPDFESKWCEGAEAYYSHIAKTLAEGKCWLCGMSAADWMKCAGLTDLLCDSLKVGFLDAAHIMSRRENGSVTPDNIRALCPNCHRIVDRLGPKRCVEILSAQPK